MSAPSAIMRSAWASAFAGSTKRPASANESGVKLRIPTPSGRRSASSRSSGWSVESATVDSDVVRRCTMLTIGALRRARERVKRPNGRERTTEAPALRIMGPLRPGSIRYLQRQLLGVVDPAPHPAFRGKQPHQLVLLVGFAHRRSELGDVAMFEFFDGIDTDRLEQLGIDLAHALDPHAVA